MVHAALLALLATTAAALQPPSKRLPPASSPANEGRFPTASTPPTEVIEAQLRALSTNDLQTAYSLCSRAWRAIIVEEGRAQGGGGQLDPPADVVRRRLRSALDETCPGLIGHGWAEIVSGLAINDRANGRLPRYTARVKVKTFHADMYDACDGGWLQAAADAAPPVYFVFTLMRQHDPPPPERLSIDPRETERFDGFDQCWFVSSIVPERNGGRGDDDDDEPPPAPLDGAPKKAAARARPRSLA